ncbi:PAS domain S-box protein [Methanosarcina sp. KYL-1]|uniref:PAS domain S-box protein n=1 Tax=Methanosarcina sp. KYL-1 TaxID=2602068 RepID=UPI002101545F|nr:PAS domain S-box protein [Methanosarcina sp. KYL-1]MCQ1537057.1 PAS domain S-box protein [Methanosarcina sp. KYL-1]
MPDFFETDEELKAFLDRIPSVIFVRKAEAGFPVEFATANVSVFGYEAADFRDGKILYADIVHPEDLEAFNFAVISNSERGIRDYTLEYRVLTKGGELRWVADRTLIRYGKNGRISRYLGIVSDVTKRRELEQRLDQEKKKFRYLLDSGVDAVIIHDRDGNILEANEESCRLFGYSREEILKLSASDVDRRYGNYVPKLMKKIYQEGKAVFSAVHTRRDGSAVSIEVNACIMEYEGKTAVLAVVKDISEKKQALEDLLHALRVKKVLETVVNNSPVIVFLSGPSEQRPMEFISENISQFGYPAEDFSSGKLAYADIVHPLDLEKVRDTFFRSYKEGRTDFTEEYRVLTGAGDVRWVEERTFIELDEDGDIEYLYGFIMDVTDRRQNADFLRLRFDFGSALASGDELNETLRQLLDMALEIEPLDSGCLYILDWDSGEMKLKLYKGLSPGFAKAASGFEKNSGMARLLQIGKPVYRHFSELSTMAGLKAPPGEKLRAAAFIPLTYRNRVQGVLQLTSHLADELPETARNQLETIAFELGTAIGRIGEKTELRQTSSDLQGLFNSLKDFILIVDQEGCIVHSNPAFRKRLGYPEKELRGKNILSLHPHRKVLEAAKNFSEILDGKTSLYSMPFVDKEGLEVPAETWFSRGSWRGQEVLIALARPEPVV